MYNKRNPLIVVIFGSNASFEGNELSIEQKTIGNALLPLCEVNIIDV
jgi:hypothetical protein